MDANSYHRDGCPARVDLIAIAAALERDFRLPSGTLRQGSISHLTSDRNRGIWMPSGGVAACRDSCMAAAIAEAMAADAGNDCQELLATLEGIVRRKLSRASCTLDIGLYHCGCIIPARDAACGAIETLRPEEIWPDGDRVPGTDLIIGIRQESTVLAYASRVPSLQVDGRWLHAVGVWTHPDHRRKELGKQVVSALLALVAAENGGALWNCDARNAASLRLARSTGFVEHLRVLSWREP